MKWCFINPVVYCSVSPPARPRGAAQHGECRPQHEWLTVLYNHGPTPPGRQTCVFGQVLKGMGVVKMLEGIETKDENPMKVTTLKTRKHLLLLKCIMALQHLLSCLELESDRDLNWSWRTAISEILLLQAFSHPNQDLTVMKFILSRVLHRWTS